MPQLDRIIELIDGYSNGLYDLDTDKNVVPQLPEKLATNLLLIRGLLVQLVDKVAESEAEYRHAKAARFDKFIKEGMKKSPAFEQLEMEQDLIDMKVNTERIRNYLKYTDGLCSSIQSVLKFKTSTNV
jgi:hypothetical protein